MENESTLLRCLKRLIMLLFRQNDRSHACPYNTNEQTISLSKHSSIQSLTCDKPRKGPVDPATNKDHGKNVGHIAFHHVRQHAWVC